MRGPHLLVWVSVLVLSLSGRARAERSRYSEHYEQCPIDVNQTTCLWTGDAARKNGTERCPALDNPSVILREGTYQDGKLNGEYVCRNFRGEETVHGYYEDGKLEGEHRELGDHSVYKENPDPDWKKRISSSWQVRRFHRGFAEGVTYFVDLQGRFIEAERDCWNAGEAGARFLPHCLSLKYGKVDAEVRAVLNEELKKHHAEMNRAIEEKDRNGKLRLKARLVDGKYDGSYEVFFPSGKLERKSLYKAGQVLSSEEYFESGKLHRRTLYRDGDWQKKEVFYENGSKHELRERLAGKEGLSHVQLYDDQNRLRHDFNQLSEYDSDWGRHEGPDTSYDEKGRIISQGAYAAKGRVGKWVHNYYELGIYSEQLWSDGNLVEDTRFKLGSRVPFEKTEYMPDGSEKRHLTLQKDSAI